MANISQLPLSKVPFLDGDSGLVSREWYRFLNNMFGLTGGGGSDLSLSDVQVGPATVYTDQTAELQKNIDGLGLGPANTPQASEARYGSFYADTLQTIAVANTPAAITFGQTDAALGVTIGATTSRITVDRPGMYQIDGFVRFFKSTAGTAISTIWLRKNGVDLAGTGLTIRVGPAPLETRHSAPYVLQMAAGDYVELMWSANSNAMQVFPEIAAAPYPLIPSARIRVVKITG